MDPLLGAATAALVAWLSILAAVYLPVGRLDSPRARQLGAASLLLVGLGVLGLPVPPWLPVAVLGLGAAGLAVARVVKARSST